MFVTKHSPDHKVPFSRQLLNICEPCNVWIERLKRKRNQTLFLENGLTLTQLRDRGCVTWHGFV